MSGSIFGTDGVRGTPSEFPLDTHTITRLGAATVRTLQPDHPQILVARDTRESGHWIEDCLANGVAAAGGSLVSIGVMPTPATAFLTASQGFDAGFVISASHNPFPDNGVKVLTADGMKASHDFETELSALILDSSWAPVLEPSGAAEKLDLTDTYVEYLLKSVAVGTDTRHRGPIAVDCANGSTSVVAPRVFRRLGFDVIALNADPNGRNINDQCGSTHPEGLQRVVREQACPLGVAFDGDGDRAILVDGNGDLVDGDAVLYVCATHLASRGQLPGPAVVATVMSNIGLEVAFRDAGIALYRCPVGDRQVFEEMQRLGVAVGGEQSGHIIFSRVLSTGDGLLTALSVIDVMNDTGQELAELRRGLRVFPQVLVNVPVRAKPAVEDHPEIVAAIQRAEETLGADGRVLVRYSGTEPLLRVMIEGRDEPTVGRLADMIAQEARGRLG